MKDVIKSILAGIAATPFILMFTIGVGLVTGLNPHFLLISVLVTNIIGIILNRNSSDFFNIGPGLVVAMFVMQDSMGVESGSFNTFFMLAVPSIVFCILSFLPFKYLLVPNRVIAILTFGIGFIIILKQLPIAFGYNPMESDFSNGGEEKSFLETTTLSNWIQLSIALSIPLIALVGHRFKKANFALFLATLASICLGYLLGFGITPLKTEILHFNEPFQLKWTFSPEMMYSSLRNGITITVAMLISFWSDFSTLNHDHKENRKTINKSLRTVGFGNLISGFFGVMPANISLVGSFSIRAFGGKKWISKVPIILLLIVIAVIGVPNFNVPLFAFAGFLIYIGILLLMKTWNLLQEAHWIEYVFTFIIGLIIILTDLMIGFGFAMLYALVMYLIEKGKPKDKPGKSFETKNYE